MSDYLKNFVSESSGESKTGIAFIDNTPRISGRGHPGHMPLVPITPPAPPAPKNHVAGVPANMTKFINRDDSIHATWQPRKGVNEEIIIPRFKKSVNAFLNKSTILYGPSQTGKTVLVHDVMYTTRDIFPYVFIFAPTNDENQDYDGIVPAPLIYTTNWGITEIKNIYQRQKAAAAMYKTANNLKVLEKLFMRVATPGAKSFLKKILGLKEKAVKDAESKSTSLSDKKHRLKEIDEVFEARLIIFYKQVIRPNIKRLTAMNLTEEEKYALRYRNFNPRILVVFDDAMTDIMKLLRVGKKQDEEVIKEFFFRGRHAFITHMYTFQDDCKLDSEIRKNAFISIFTSKQVALAFFGRGANNFPMAERKRAEAIINAIFTEENETRHVKLVYNRLDKTKFYYIIGDEHENFEMCAKIIRLYCEKVCAKGNNFDTSNPYFQKFTDRA